MRTVWNFSGWLLVVTLLASLLACVPPTETPTLPGGPLNSTLALESGVATASNGNGSTRAGGLAVSRQPSGVAYILTFPQGDAVLPPEPGEEFAFGVRPDGTVVMQARVGQIEASPDGRRAFTVPQGEEWLLAPGTAEVLAGRWVAGSTLNVEEFVPTGGVEAPSFIEAVPRQEPEVITPLPTTPPLPPSPEPVTPEAATLRLWHPWAYEPEGEALVAAVRAFEARYPQVKVEIVPMGWTGLREAVTAALMAGTPPDLVIASSDDAIVWADQGLLQPVDDLEAEGRLGDLYPAALDGLRYGEHLWGVPLRVGVAALYYDRQQVDPPPPTNRQMLEYLTAGVPLAIPRHFYYTYGLLTGYGGTLVAPSGGAGLDSQFTYAYLDFLRALLGTGNLVYGDPVEAAIAFREGRVAMIVDGSWMLPTYRAGLGERLGVALLPRIEETGQWPSPLIGSDVCVIPAGVGETQRQAAAALAAALAGEDFQRRIAQDLNTLPAAIRFAQEDPLLEAFSQQARLATPGVVHPRRAEILEVGQEMVERVLLQGWGIEEAIAPAAEQIGALLFP